MDNFSEVSPRIRSQRLAVGKCPEHGRTLVLKEDMVEEGRVVGSVFRCPESNCAFDIVARAGTRLAKLLRR